MKKTVRMLAVALCAMLVCTLLAGCGGSGKTTLYVYNCTDYIDPKVIDMFEEKMDCKVVYDTYESNESMYTKVKNSKSEYDVVFPSDYMAEKMIREGMLAELDMTNIPNAANIDEKYMGLSFDPENTYTVPYMWGTLGILYNTSMVEEDEVKSWGVLWDEKYEGEILMYDSMRDSIAVALMYLGYDINTREESELIEARDVLMEQKPIVLSYVTDQCRDMMVGGEAALSVVYSGDAIRAIAMNDELAYSIPDEGSNYFFDVACILSTSQNKELAEAFINFLCDPEIAEMNRAKIGYLTPVAETYEALSDAEKGVYPDEETLSRCAVYADLGEYTELYDEYWTQVLAFD